MKRLLIPTAIGLVSWFGATAFLLELLLPPTCKGCEDDFGTGVIVMSISAYTLWPL
ncbi:hypothetical protein G8A07_03245 [Roseateles sp. DAIF2]|uniref:hypothetical protein n=1 Tax=Roseateles sp. DAIF2 TaxID=2714952 RepID=UPI0018A32016|nr:hypothetical protein [Roseateles sp. DAIF2]QPF72043.1 hypothetical protein G8A07_03245 [Roseateles sp. DAIF2]